MAKQFLSDEIIQHIQDGYYAAHEQDLTEDQVHELSEEQLRYYTRQGKEYQAAQKKKQRLVIGLLIGGVVAVIAVVAVLFISLNSSDNLYDSNSKSDGNTSNSSQDSSGNTVIGAPASNTRAGAKDDAAQ